MRVLRTNQSAKRSSSLIGRRFSVEEERRVEETSPSDDVAEIHMVMCESESPNK